MDLLVRHIGRLHPIVTPVVKDAAVLIRDGSIAWLGSEQDLPSTSSEVLELDVGGRTVTPGFVDAHTHLVWEGSRREEFVARLSGQSYDGGGINTTVAATRAATDQQLIASATERAKSAIEHGTTTMEIKTGYGLTQADEMRMLAVIAELDRSLPLRVESTYLGAHVVPDRVDRDDYVDEVIASLPNAKASGAQWCDVFCDEGVFTILETRRILTAAKDQGFGLRLHAEEIAHTGAAGLAAELGCASADHLEHVSEADARAMAAAGVVGVLLPTVTLSLRTFAFGQVPTLKAAGVELALATDCNPGTSWCESMPYVIQLACLVYGLTVEEALAAATLGGAHSLRRDDVGHLAVGACGDLAVLDVDHEADLVAHLGASVVSNTVLGGRVWERQAGS
ncbi:MAG TPA: imidazolonepropionase [Actinomycetes bacterium]|nr:imidazolonepropionase [Actinomycetes bacterium]